MNEEEAKVRAFDLGHEVLQLREENALLRKFIEKKNNRIKELSIENKGLLKADNINTALKVEITRLNKQVNKEK